MAVIDGSEFFDGCGDTVTVEGVDYILHTKGRTAFPDCPELLAIRNASITASWQCPERRKAQGDRVRAARASGTTKHSDPGHKARHSAAMTERYKCPDLRKRLSDIKKAYWAAKRALNSK